ncbi:MAG: phosphoribosylglycinamide formyltransferase [Gammaproteobacteria bacterium]|nr:phosphoribosylglycinamide formyltransferase [Gammaproteobacteria bacterium]MYF67494.1 phosphoribosylglycinamide formyltransferase [Gammaproteobacteria bacterium]MYK37400.1 phosphoribosylglycinamide formyltransferase [Gammaproteobacteria bacterium]
MSLRTVVLLSGTGTNFQAILDRAASDAVDVEPVGALSDRPGAQGLERARRAGIPAIAVPRGKFPDARSWWDGIAARLRTLSPDVLVLAGFMRILPPELCREYKGRVLNIHPSLLPRFPGLNTYRRVLAAGDRWHGTTVHFVTEDLDAGPRVAQARIRVGRGDDEDSLRARVQACEHVLYPRVLEWMSQDRLAMGARHAILDGSELSEPVVFEEGQLL